MKSYLITFFIITFLSCNKRYEDDPYKMKFISLKKRIEGTWVINKIVIDGIDSSQLLSVDSLDIYNRYTFDTFSKQYTDGSLSVYRDKTNRSFKSLTYDFLSDGKRIELTINNVSLDSVRLKTFKPYGPINSFAPNKYYWEIKRLTKEEFIISINENYKIYELQFKK
jgi:hypothetical protein